MNSRWRRLLELVVLISISAAVILVWRWPLPDTAMSATDNNPDKFYLWSTGKVFAYTFTYNPHAADAWMFRTAEGHLQNTNQVLDFTPQHGAP